MLTEDETKLYDRSIRLWGLQVQQRIRAASILLVGMSGCNVEIAKNLVLAGVKRVSIWDDEPLIPQSDGAFNFLAHRALFKEDESAGGAGETPVVSRGQACLASLQELNPYVQVDLVHELVDAELVCASEQSLQRVAQLNEQCRGGKLGAKFVSVHSLGGDGGVALFDFGPTYNYRRNDDGAGAAQQQHFVPVAQTWHSPPPPTTKPSRHIPAAWLKFLARARTADDDNGAKGVGPSHSAAICAIVGGVVAQEIIKVFSAVDEAMNNVFVFDPVAGGRVLLVE